MDALLKENEKLKEIALGVGPSYMWMASAGDSGFGLNNKEELSTSVHLSASWLQMWYRQLLHALAVVSSLCGGLCPLELRAEANNPFI